MVPLHATLILVYNADAGLLNAVRDAVWKAVRPATYPCSLCALTYGAVSMRRVWRRFLDGLNKAIVFHHRDDFAAAFPGHSFALPVILIRTGEGAPRVLVSREQLDSLRDVQDLIEVTQAALDYERVRAVG